MLKVKLPRKLKKRIKKEIYETIVAEFILLGHISELMNRKVQKKIKQAISETFAEQMKVRKEDIEEELKHYDIKRA